MDNALAIVGVYFTLIGFISGLFFTRLDSWYGDVKEFEGSLRSLSNREDYKVAQSKKDGLKSSTPMGSFIAVGFLTTMLTLLSLLIPTENPALNPNLYLKTPLIMTVLFYWAGGALLFRKGNSILQDVTRKIAVGLRGN
jgi:hypothetical protein